MHNNKTEQGDITDHALDRKDTRYKNYELLFIVQHTLKFRAVDKSENKQEIATENNNQTQGTFIQDTQTKRWHIYTRHRLIHDSGIQGTDTNPREIYAL